MAELIDKFTDIILVGDSLGPVLYGYKTTREVSLDMIINHAKAVVKKSKTSFVLLICLMVLMNILSLLL